MMAVFRGQDLGTAGPNSPIFHFPHSGRCAQALDQPLQPGDRVLTHNGPAELTRFTEGGGCVVTYRVGDAYVEKTYAKCFGKKAGSARLQPIPPSVLPPKRATRSSATSDATRKAVLDHAYEYCKVSLARRQDLDNDSRLS